MSLTPQEREELATIYAQMRAGGAGWNPTAEERQESNERLNEALWAAMCHTTGRCGLFVPGQYPNTPQARIYELMIKAIQ
jgi:hypothetical protein